MALTQVTAGDTAQASDVNQFKNALEGASGATVSYSLLVASGQNFLMTLSENAGGKKLSIRDSDLAEIFHVDSNGNMKAYGTATVVGTATVGALTTAGAVTGATVAATGALTAASADIAGTLQLGSSNITTCTAAGLLKHEAGGLEFDVSAITTGGIVKGASSGVMAILARGSANQLLAVNAGGTDIAWATVSGASLDAILTDFKDNRALLCWSDFTMEIPANNESFDYGVTFHYGGGEIAADASSNSGGQYQITTTATGNYWSSFDTYYNVVDYTKDPYFAARLTSRAANSALQVQAWGFNANGNAVSWDDTTNDCAMFRSITTGNLFAVTGNGSAETTTDLGSVYTLGDQAVFEIVSSSNGGSYVFKINGTTRATHTGTLPDASMRPILGIANNTTTALILSGIDYMVVYQDRT